MRNQSHPVTVPTAGPADYEPLIARARGACYVLLGEASHGTDEFYRARAEITKRLITEERFTLVAVEADWPHAYRVNCFVRGAGDDTSAERALSYFRRFPSWMWRNTAVAEFVAWLREYNDSLPAAARKIGFYGLDLYSIYTSMDEVVRYLEGVDPDAADRARARYACFGHFGRDAHAYARETGLRGAESCQRGAVQQLVELRGRAAQSAQSALHDLRLDEDRRFYAEQNARLVVDAEQYYRAVYGGGQESWNLRDRHMAQTLEELVAHARRRERSAKAVVWAHNSYVIDARELEGSGLERAIGVVYRPETEPWSHYVHARLGEQFDAVIHVDETHAVEPLERSGGWERGELPDLYPWGV